ncbi:MAG: (d)CMP kinase [Cytophagales bacterium]|nr:(d)CMP kinase [Bernardetiaceae bacterium]MDW8211114.1 (d)CMP kinase [Cytophagales bacterium]
MKKIIIAIDGYSACGKSTTAKAVAAALGYTYIDSGAMYRAVTLYFMRHQVDLEDEEAISHALQNIEIEFRSLPEYPCKAQTYLNGHNVEEEIRSMEVSRLVSQVSKIPQVRRFLVAQQQKMGKKKGIVMDGRDIGTVVFPEAELKLFLTADLEERARRRQAELLAKDQVVSLEEVKENLRTRDLIDTTRSESPLRKAEDAIEIDTTHITFDEQVEMVLRKAYHKMMCYQVAPCCPTKSQA